MRSSVTAVARDVGEALIDLVVPRWCAGCGEPQHLLCPSCRDDLAGPAFATVPNPCPDGLPPVWAVAAYGGVAREALLAHKERNRLGLARPLGDALARCVVAAVPEPEQTVALVPVPSSRAATRRRGHDPVLRCARSAAYLLRRTGRPVVAVPALRVSRRVADQSGLSAGTRWVNLAGAHAVRRRYARALSGDVRVVLVDDLVTTGASLAEAARALRAAGLEPVAAAVVAATARRSRLDRPAGSA